MSSLARDPRTLRVRIWLAAALLLCLFPLAPRLARPLDGQLRRPLTPVDLTDTERARQWLFLDSCRPLLPPGSSFTVLADDPRTEMALFMMGIGLFPSSQPLAHSYYFVPTPDEAARARYVLRYQPAPSAPEPGLRLVARVPGGALYERAARP